MVKKHHRQVENPVQLGTYEQLLPSMALVSTQFIGSHTQPACIKLWQRPTCYPN